MQRGCFTDNVSLFTQPNITDKQFFEVDSNLGHMLYFTPEWSPKLQKMGKCSLLAHRAAIPEVSPRTNYSENRGVRGKAC